MTVTTQLNNPTASSVIGADGTARVVLGPQLPRERWNVRTVTCTSNSMTISISTNDGTVVDTTTGDIRPTVTDNTQFTLMAGHYLIIAWSGGTPGTPVTASLTGTKQTGG